MSKSLDAQLIDCLQTKVWGRVHRHVPVTDSTNDDLARWMEQGTKTGSLVTADRQRRGRGRLGRHWDSSAAQDLYASVALVHGPGVAGMGALGLAVGLGLIQALEGQFPELGTWRLKWPNDLLLDGKKIGGVLCEARWSRGEAQVACGFGLNLLRNRFEDPGVAQRATSLALVAQERGKTLPARVRVEVLAQLLLNLEQTVPRYLSGGFGVIASAYRGYCRELGRAVRLSGQGPDGSPPGTVFQAIDLDEDGALLVQRARGQRAWRVQSDDVWLVAP